MPMRPPRHHPPRLNGATKRQPEDRPTPAQRGYDRRWARLAQQIRIRDNYTCQICKRLAFGAERNGKRINPPVDHIIPHKGQDDPLFWDEGNLRTLCHDCHNSRHSNG